MSQDFGLGYPGGTPKSLRKTACVQCSAPIFKEVRGSGLHVHEALQQSCCSFACCNAPSASVSEGRCGRGETSEPRTQRQARVSVCDLSARLPGDGLRLPSAIR